MQMDLANRLYNTEISVYGSVCGVYNTELILKLDNRLFSLCSVGSVAVGYRFFLNRYFRKKHFKVTILTTAGLASHLRLADICSHDLVLPEMWQYACPIFLPTIQRSGTIQDDCVCACL